MACLVWHRFPTPQLFGAPQHPQSHARGWGRVSPTCCPPGMAGSQQCPPKTRQGSGAGGEKAGWREGSP